MRPTERGRDKQVFLKLTTKTDNTADKISRDTEFAVSRLILLIIGRYSAYNGYKSLFLSSLRKNHVNHLFAQIKSVLAYLIQKRCDLVDQTLPLGS